MAELLLDDFDDDMMLDGTEFDDPTPSSAPPATTTMTTINADGPANEKTVGMDAASAEGTCTSESDNDFFGYSSASDNDDDDRLLNLGENQKKRKKEQGTDDSDEDDAEEEEDDVDDDTLPLWDRQQRVSAGLARWCESLEASLQRLSVSLDLQTTQPVPLSSPWFFSTEAARGMKAGKITDKVRGSKRTSPVQPVPPPPEGIQSASTDNNSTNNKATTVTSTPPSAEELAEGCRVIGSNRLRGIILKELQTHRAKLDALKALKLTPPGAGGDAVLPNTEEEAMALHQAAVIRAAAVTLRCSVAPFIHLLTSAIEGEANNGLVAIKHWMRLPTSSARHLQRAAQKNNSKALKKLTLDEAGSVDESTSEGGCEVDVIGSNGFRWFKVRAARGFAKSMHRLYRHLKNTIGSESGITLSMLDPQLGRLQACARDPCMNGCPWGTAPELILVTAERLSVEVAEALEQRGVKLAYFSSFPFATLPPSLSNETSTASSEPQNSTSPTSAAPLQPLLPPVTWKPTLIVFDVTAMVALCCDTCNGAADHQFDPEHHVLRQQAASELAGERAAAPILSALRAHTRVLSTSDAPLFTSAQRDAIIKLHAPTTSSTSSFGDGNAAQEDSTTGSSANIGDKFSSLLEQVSEGFPSAASQLPDPPQLLVDNGVYDHKEEDAYWSEMEKDAFGQFLKLRTDLKLGGGTSEEGKGKNNEPIPNWVVVEGAWKEFCWILTTVAGPREFFRAGILSRLLRIVGPGQIPSHYVTPVMALRESSKVHRRHRDVFGVSEALHGLTLTATRQFVHAAVEQGATLSVVFHPSRALTERKRCKLEAPKEIRKLALAERKERQKAEKAERNQKERVPKLH